MTIPVVRKRAKRPKTRTGCRTCRQRHIKCDEEKPECRRCRASGRECAGYDVTRISNEACKSQAILLPKGSAVGSVSIPTLYPTSVCRSPALATSGMNTAEHYAFDFFRLKTVQHLPGSAWTLSWERLALQMGHHEPAVTHAAVALGSIHRALTFESFRGPAGIDPEQHQFALNQYNKAMGYLRKHIEAFEHNAADSDVEVVLLVSLLFFCFEVLHSEDARATMHLRTGLRILYERIRRDNPLPLIDENGETKRIVTMHVTPKTNLDVILQTFVRLDGDLTIVGEDEPYLFPVCYEPLPTSFYSLEEALVHLDAIGSKTHDFCRDIVVLADREVISKRPDCDALDDDLRNCLACAASRTIELDSRPDIIVRMQDIKHDLNTWMTALASVPTDGQKQTAHYLTQIHFFYIWFVVATWRDDNEMLVDRFDEQFAHILSLAEQYVDLHWEVTASRHTRTTVTQSSASCTRQAFTLGTDLVPCIAMIAFKSRTSSIRRRCVELLRSINLQGVFDSFFLAAFCNLICNLEEKRARAITGIPEGIDLQCHQVPEEARFIEIELSPMHYKHDFYKADVGRLVYAIYDQSGQLEAHEELFHVDRPTGTPGQVYKRDDPEIKMFWQIDTAAISRECPAHTEHRSGSPHSSHAADDLKRMVEEEMQRHPASRIQDSGGGGLFTPGASTSRSVRTYEEETGHRVSVPGLRINKHAAEKKAVCSSAMDKGRQKNRPVAVGEVSTSSETDGDQDRPPHEPPRSGPLFRRTCLDSYAVPGPPKPLVILSPTTATGGSRGSTRSPLACLDERTGKEKEGEEPRCIFRGAAGIPTRGRSASGSSPEERRMGDGAGWPKPGREVKMKGI